MLRLYSNAYPQPKDTKIYLIDFTKYNLINTNCDNIEASPYLDFIEKVNKSTGEMGAYIYAYYKGLEFRIYETTEKTKYRRITVEGSLHKYWNNGAHNFNDFGINEINEVLNDLKIKFNIMPGNCVLKQLEIGVNIIPPINTKTLLKGCIMHKTKPFKWIYTNDEGNYVQLKNQRHFIKLYDKRTHYANKGFEIDYDILRIEKKWSKMVELNRKGIFTLKDLINFGLGNFKSDLLRLWKDVLYCDLKTIKGTKNENKYNNLNWWETHNYENFKYHRIQLNKLLNSDPNCTKKIVSNLIEKKIDFLTNETTVINPLYIRLQSVVTTPVKTDQNRRFCNVTGLNISMQRNDSILLSHTGLKYYLKTDKKVFKEIKQKYLSQKWKDADAETQIKEIAHNIRNKSNNLKLKQLRIYPIQQMQLFDIAN